MASIIELANDERTLVEDLFDPVGRRGVPARYSRRSMVEAILFLARTGCQWRYLPDHYPPWEAVWQQWRRWRANGVWARAMSRLTRLIRSRKRAHVEPTMVMLDAQTVRGGRAGPTTPAIGTSVRGRVALATAGLGAAWVAGYLFIIDRQGTEMDTPSTVFLAAFVSVMAALALGAAVIRNRNDRWAQAMLYAAAGGFLPAGVLGLASIGLPLILAGLLALAAAGPRLIPLPLGVAAAVLSASAFFVGVALTIRVS